MRLFIAEKPSVAQAIAQALGGTKQDGKWVCASGDVVTWCYGHMLELAPPDTYTPSDVPLNGKGKKIWRFDELPIIPEKWLMLPKDSTTRQLKVIKEALSGCKVVCNAGDPDRAGQAIVDQILDHYNFNGQVLRYWCNSLDKVSVKRALDSLSSNEPFKPMGEADFARSCADWLIGMNLSRAFTLANRAGGGSSLITCGRVQSPTLRIVVDRDRAIKNFKPKSFFKIFALVQAGDHEPYKAAWVPGNAQAGLDAESRLIDSEIANQLACGHASGIIKDVAVVPKTQQPPICFSLSDLQFTANKLFGYDAEKTLNICQALYEKHAVVTYPRVDSGYLPESQLDERNDVAACILSVDSSYSELIDAADFSIKSKVWNDDKVTAHHGIIPTISSETKIGNLSTDEKNLYDLIVRRYIAQFYPTFKYDQTTIIHEFNREIFKATGKVVTDQGWKKALSLESKATPEDGKPEDAGLLPPVVNGQSVDADIVKQDAKTTPPKPFTEGDLIRAMMNIHLHVDELSDDPELKKLLKENEGIGTEATRASIISDLKRRGFLVEAKKKIISSELGQQLIDILPPEVTSPVLSAKAESVFSEIEKGSVDKFSFIGNQAKFVASVVEKTRGADIKIASDVKEKAPAIICPKCNKNELMRRPDKKKKKVFYWMCKGVFDTENQCKTFFKEKKGQPDFKS